MLREPCYASDRYDILKLLNLLGLAECYTVYGKTTQLPIVRKDVCPEAKDRRL